MPILLLISSSALASTQPTANTQLPFEAVCPLAANNLLSNSTFNTIGSNGSSTTFTGNGSAGNSAAANWILWNNGFATIKTELLPSTFAGNRRKIIHVTTTGNRSGLVQVFLPVNTGSARSISAAWVFVRSGRVSIGTGNGGNTGLDTTSLTTNKWERLQARNGVSPANEFIIYSASNGADFYVASACVTPVPN